MTHREPPEQTYVHDSAKRPLVVRVTDNDVQCEVLEKLARLEAKMEMLMGSGEPGRMKLVEDRVGRWSAMVYAGRFMSSL